MKFNRKHPQENDQKQCQNEERMIVIAKKLSSEDGMGTIEIVIIIAVLVGIAFLFHAFAKGFFGEITSGIKSNTKIDELFR